MTDMQTASRNNFFMSQNGLFSAIPYVLFWLFINVGGVISDMLRQRGWKTKTVRKIMMTLGKINAVQCSATLFVSSWRYSLSYNLPAYSATLFINGNRGIKSSIVVL